jgi:hypothetical protein
VSTLRSGRNSQFLFCKAYNQYEQERQRVITLTKEYTLATTRLVDEVEALKQELKQKNDEARNTFTARFADGMIYMIKKYF